MPAGEPRRAPARRMHRVLEHIDRHLDEPLDLPRLAAVAHFSPFHFHRLFAAWMGETCGEYLRRRRLETAAMRLQSQPGVPVLQVALAVGFGSGEAFARAFRTHFGASPSAWRAAREADRHGDRNVDQVLGKHDQAGAGVPMHDGRSLTNSQWSAMTLEVIVLDLPETPVAYLRYTGPYGSGVSKFWAQTVAPWMATHGLMRSPMFGISLDDPDITPPAKCRYDAAVQVAPGAPAPPPALCSVLPGGRYALLRFEGTAEQAGEAWQRLLRDWLPASGYQLDARPCFERYPPGGGFDPATGGFRCEICIAVKPL